jgi:hypothetical protein
MSDRWAVAAGAMAGGLAGVGMYVAMAVAAVAQGLGATYPLWAVQGLMSGARVLPDHPRGILHEPIFTDWLTAPLYFLLPAVVVGALTSRLAARRRGRATSLTVAVPVAAAATAALYLVLVVGLGMREASVTAQRATTGYGIQQLGVTAWAVGHVVYLALLVGLLVPVSRARWLRARPRLLRRRTTRS